MDQARSWSGRGCMTNSTCDKKTFLLFTAVYLVAFLFLAKVQIFGDGFHYFIFFPSLFDRLSLNLSDYYSRYFTLSPQAIFHGMEPTGYARNLYPFGSSLLQFPFFLAVWVYDRLFGCFAQFGFHDFMTPPYKIAQVLSAWIYGLLGFYFLFALISRAAGKRGRWMVLVTLFAATPLWNYLIHDPSYSHVYSFFAISLTYWLWYGPFAKDSIRNGLLLGSSLGLVVLIRWQDILFLVPIACELTLLTVRKARTRAEYPRNRMRRIFLLGVFLGFSVWILPQLVYWRILNGSFLLVPHGSGAFTPGDTHFYASLFSRERGMFRWHPILPLATLGLVKLAWSRKRYCWLFLGIGLMWIVTGVIRDWHGSYAFGQRRWVSALPFFGLGLAYLFQVRSFAWRLLLSVICAVAIVWNFLFHCAWANGFLPDGELHPSRVFRIAIDAGPSVLCGGSFKLAFFWNWLHAHPWSENIVPSFVLVFTLAMVYFGISYFCRSMWRSNRKGQPAPWKWVFACISIPVALMGVFLSAHFLSAPSYRLDFRQEPPSESNPWYLYPHRIYPTKNATNEIDPLALKPNEPLHIPIAVPRRVRRMTVVSSIRSVSGEFQKGDEIIEISLSGDGTVPSFPLRVGLETDFPNPKVGSLARDDGNLRLAWGTLSESGEPAYRFESDFEFEEMEVQRVTIEGSGKWREVVIESLSFSTTD